MKVARIQIRTPDKKTVVLERANLLRDMGIQGDKNAKGGDRQLSLLPLKIREDIDKGLVTGLCLPRFTENITYTGDAQLVVGERYTIGEAVMEIGGTRKKCFAECENVIKNKPCTLVKYVRYAKIISTGAVDVNAEIQPFTGLEDHLKLWKK